MNDSTTKLIAAAAAAFLFGQYSDALDTGDSNTTSVARMEEKLSDVRSEQTQFVRGPTLDAVLGRRDDRAERMIQALDRIESNISTLSDRMQANYAGLDDRLRTVERDLYGGRYKLSGALPQTN